MLRECECVCVCVCVEREGGIMYGMYAVYKIELQWNLANLDTNWTVMCPHFRG